ncbi:Probable outer membrane component of multidrug efflux pump [Campylobacter sputorum subsp. bubulus]|uniref:Probable outer membrane component of multidrug efflux pump n=1 Tax=Campylobacter sputorum subsp. sputorum TaxID=32024 RepID=A0A381DGU3_9BACT|nr:TolC family protein [Campylobacter sputorum]ASM34981.1 TolC-like outer membrane efflux protein [Campylobacter sputorum aubsp. sputorum RM3237]KAB0581888.1 TolC family protein [Campylobacter sputorum subsp. sputorum]QEL05172.1 outer membrane efflux protein, TolC family [Campylobacter sputorum subsp. sputorum]SUX09558.1 Probable outer membrane component of multidrug efflux pump [Campylobacter sputorum subsp. sputorum]SUX30757.1 Probable outer membrane component of multidrug efflux pump [Campy
MKLWLFFVPALLFSANLSDIIIKAQQNEIATIDYIKSINARNELSKTKSSYMPNISLKGGYIGLDNDTMQILPSESKFVNLNVDFMIYDGGKREASFKSLEHLSNLSQIQFLDTKNKIALDMITLYFSAKNINSLISAKNSQINYISENLKRIKEFYAAGLAAVDEYETLNALYHEQIASKLELEIKLEEIKNDIALISNENLDDFSQNVSINEPNFQETNQNAEILKINEQILAKKEEINIASSGYLPKFYLSAIYGYQKLNFPVTTIKDNDNKAIMAMFEWDIFNFGKTKKEVEIKKYESKISELNKNFIERSNKIYIKNLVSNLNLNKAKIKADKIRLDAAISSFDATNQKYQAGLMSYNDFLSSLSRLYEARAGLNVEQNSYEINKAKYYYLLGMDVLDEIVR